MPAMQVGAFAFTCIEKNNPQSASISSPDSISHKPKYTSNNDQNDQCDRPVANLFLLRLVVHRPFADQGLLGRCELPEPLDILPTRAARHICHRFHSKTSFDSSIRKNTGKYNRLGWIVEKRDRSYLVEKKSESQRRKIFPITSWWKDFCSHGVKMETACCMQSRNYFVEDQTDSGSSNQARKAPWITACVKKEKVKGVMKTGLLPGEKNKLRTK